VAQQIKKVRVIIIILFFISYFIIAARPVPREAVLSQAWLSSLSAGSSFESSAGYAKDRLIPFTLGSHFGFVDLSGNLVINKVKTGDIYLGENLWTEYDAEPERIEIKNTGEETVLTIENPGGYPFFLDNRIFIFGSEQNSLSEVGADGEILWTYEFGALLTCIDAAAGMVLTGSIDGVIEILDSQGKRVFYFEPGGSNYAVILGCAISSNGSRVGIISGIEQQRFLYLERFGGSGEYKVVYHEFLDTGFRRPVRISFIDDDNRLVFERQGGIDCYNIKSRRMIRIPLEGEIAAIDNSGEGGFFFLINSISPRQKELIGIKFPQESLIPFLNFTWERDAVFMRAAFKSDNVFLSRTGSKLITGGGTTLISLNMEEH
jgi:hypothetical protein